MFKRQKEIDRKVNELVAELYDIEGEITDYLTHQMFDGYKNIKDRKTKEQQLERTEAGFQIIKKFSEQECDEIFQFDSDDRYSDDCLLEIKDNSNRKYHFLIKFSNYTFKCHDFVKLIALPSTKKNYDLVYAMVNTENKMFWTGAERGRLESLKLGFGMVFGFMFWQTILIGFTFLFFLFLSWITNDFEGLLGTFTIAILGQNVGTFVIGVLLVSAWWVFATEQDYLENIYAEAIFKKLGFNAVKHVELSKYSLVSYYKKNNMKKGYIWTDRELKTYMIDVALKEHNQKYKSEMINK